VEIETRGRSESSRSSRRIIPERNRGRISGRRETICPLAGGRKRPASLGRGGNTREKLLGGNNRAMAAESPRSNRRRIRCHVTFLYISRRDGCIACLLDCSIPRGRTCRGWPVSLLIWRARGSRRCLLPSRAGIKRLSSIF
jgi:hypothetical protein